VKQAIFHPEARHELIESVAFYEARFAGLGYRFLASVETTTGRIVFLAENSARLA